MTLRSTLLLLSSSGNRSKFYKFSDRLVRYPNAATNSNDFNLSSPYPKTQGSWTQSEYLGCLGNSVETHSVPPRNIDMRGQLWSMVLY